MAKCVGSTGKPKQRFETREGAEGRRASLIAIGKWTARGSNVYFCNQCGCFHAGATNRANRGRTDAKNVKRHLDTQ